MDHRLTIDFFASLAKLAKTEQRQVRDTLEKAIVGHEAAGLRPHKIAHPSNKILSYSPNMDLRIIAHKDKDKLTFLYVGHHDVAYDWIGRRRIVHLGDSFRIVLIAEQKGDASQPAKLPRALSKMSQSAEWLPYGHDVSACSSDDDVLELLDRIPLGPDQKEQVLERLILRSKDHRLLPTPQVFTVHDDTDLQKALEYPMDLWRVFLHPKQQEVVLAPANASTILTGGPGTGKTVCLVHRAARLSLEIGADEVVLLTTFKESLANYLVNMLGKIDANRDRIVIVDVVTLDSVHIDPTSTPGSVKVGDFATLQALLSGEKEPEGCLLLDGQRVWYSQHGQRRRIRHLLVDECQDYREKQLTALHHLAKMLPHTIAFDYTQAIYRPCPWDTAVLSAYGKPESLIRLDYCYRLNHEIVKRIKAVVNTIRVLAQFAAEGQYRLQVSQLEEELVRSLTPAIDGTPPVTYAYQDKEHLHELLRRCVHDLKETYEARDIVLTAFMPELYKHSRQQHDFGADQVPEELRPYYRFIYTLKGQEYKAGILVLDESISQMLNLNQVLFTRRLPDDFRGNADNVRRMYNLLYVGLSRFRDFLAILYPAKYSLVLDSLFRDLS